MNSESFPVEIQETVKSTVDGLPQHGDFESASGAGKDLTAGSFRKQTKKPGVTRLLNDHAENVRSIPH